MTINIQNASTVNVTGHHSHKNSKAVYCIDTGEIFASTIDAAEANDVSVSAISLVCLGKTKTCNGKRFCYVSKMMENLEEITEATRVRAAKVAAYDAEIERQNAIAKAEEERRKTLAKAESDVQKYEAKVADLRSKLADVESKLENAKNELNALTCA